MIITNSKKETLNEAARLAKELKPGEVVLLSGDLGAGKTTFASGIIKAFGIKSTVTSPTFQLMINYKAKDIAINHIDAYRLSSEAEALEAGIIEAIDEKDALSLVEWHTNIKFAFRGKSGYKVDLKYISQNKRGIAIEVLSS